MFVLFKYLIEKHDNVWDEWMSEVSSEALTRAGIRRLTPGYRGERQGTVQSERRKEARVLPASPSPQLNWAAMKL